MHYINFSDGSNSVYIQNKWVRYSWCKTNLNIATLEGETKAGFLVLDEVKRDLRVALLLQVRDDALANQLGVSYHVQHLYKQLIL